MVHLGDDERYDRRHRFAGRSALRLEVICERLRRRYGAEYGLPEFGYDAEPEGYDLRAWGEARGNAIALVVTVAADYRDVADFARIYGAPPDANYHIHLFFASARVSPDEASRIRGTLPEILECPLAELPRAARGECGRWEAEAEPFGATDRRAAD